MPSYYTKECVGCVSRFVNTWYYCIAKPSFFVSYYQVYLELELEDDDVERVAFHGML